MGKTTALKARLIDDDAFSVLAIPFSGPIPSPVWPRGVDLDGETFTERTDIKADWFRVRPVDWHHGKDPTGVMGRSIVGKAMDLRMDDEGWWVDVWLAAGEERVGLIRRLAAKGAQLFGSSEPVQRMVKVGKAGEILVWPYLRQTLSTSPQNTHSIIRPLKASLDDLVRGGYHPTDAFWQEVLDSLHDLGPDLLGAKAGRTEGRALSEALSAADAQVTRLLSLYSERAQEVTDVHGGPA